MRHDQDAAVAAATGADDARSALLADLLGRVAGCFPWRETRQSCGQMLHRARPAHQRWNVYAETTP